MTAEFIKDPAALLDYRVDWSAWLGSDTIGSAAWSVPAGLTLASSSHTAADATAWLSGGVAGGEYRVACQISTAGGRADRRGFTVRVWEL